MMVPSVRKATQNTLSVILAPMIPVVFKIKRVYKNQAFLYTHKHLDKFFRLGSLPSAAFGEFYDEVHKTWNRLWNDYALKKYDALISVHYSQNGAGYSFYNGSAVDEKKKLYQASASRLDGFLSHKLVNESYVNGDRFLDAGCGLGQ